MLFRVVIFIWIILGFVQNAVICANERVHPRNIEIMKKYPRSEKMHFPNIMRVTPQEALYLYKSGKALMVHIGVEGGNVFGGIQFTESQAWSLSVKKLLKYAKGRIIITYCD